MFRRNSIGCFNLPFGPKKKECPIKDDLLDLGSGEECPIKDDLLDLSSEEECPVDGDLIDFTSDDLSWFTSQFSPENLIGLTHLGKLYRGKMPSSDQDKAAKDVTVKILVEDKRFDAVDNKLQRLEDELKFLQAPKIRGNPNLVRVIGCCREEKTLGVVYDINPHNTLHDLIIQDDFNWMQRAKTALALARLLAYLHDRKYMIRNFAPSHIVVDQKFTPVLFEFGLLVGGVLGETMVDKSDMRLGPFGYIDGFAARLGPSAFTVKSDVYAFGVLLLNLISKRIVDKEDPTAFAVTTWAKKEYESGCSLVHISIKGDPDFDHRDGPKLSKLAMQCMDSDKKKRPEMKEVLERLKCLSCFAAAR